MKNYPILQYEKINFNTSSFMKGRRDKCVLDTKLSLTYSQSYFPNISEYSQTLMTEFWIEILKSFRSKGKYITAV